MYKRQVMARPREDGEDILKQSVKNRVEAELTEIMPAEDPGAFNQAMMDLGAMVCLCLLYTSRCV